MTDPSRTNQELIEENSFLKQRIQEMELADSDRTKAEEALRESEEKHRLLIENSHDIIYTLTIDGVFNFVSPAWTLFLGHPVTQVDGQPFQPFVHPDDLAGCMAFLQKVIETGKRQEGVEYRVRHIDGSWHWHTSAAVPLKDGAGKIVGIEGTARDITAQKQLEEKLTSSEENFRTFFNTVDDMIIVGSPDGKILYTNPAMTLKLGYSPAEFKNMHVLDVHPADKRQEAEIIFATMFRGEQESCPLPLAAKSGALIPAETRVWFGKWSGVDCIFGISKDLTKEQEALQKFNRLFNSNPAPMAVSSMPERRFTEVNDAFLNALGYSRQEVIGKTAEEMDLFNHPEKQREIADQLQAQGSLANCELKVKCKDGAILDGLFSGEIIDNQGQKSFLTVMIDQTERKQSESERAELEKQNRQLQKAESLGRMAEAIAHHFNNQLGAVIGNLELAMMELPQGERAHAKINAAMKASNRAAEMSVLMLTYLGQSFDKLEPLDLSDACRGSLPIIQAIMPGNIVLDTDLPSPGPIIMANVNQIQQVMNNLLTNAWEATAQGWGAINLSVKTVCAGNIDAVHRFPLDWQPQDNAYACLEVTDAGGGIAEKDIEKIFDPFFTSNSTGRGMGLAVVLGIVRAHDGVVTVESEPDRGSTFKIFFPVSAEEVPLPPDKASQPALIVPSPSPIMPPTADGGMVLLVEDEEMVRNVAAAMIERLGFSVLEAKDGVEAVEMFRHRQDEIRCVLCDLTMPRMNGWETLAALRKLAPDIPVILASGYDKAHVMSGDHPEWPQVFLGKPYKMKGLRDALCKAMVSKKKEELVRK